MKVAAKRLAKDSCVKESLNFCKVVDLKAMGEGGSLFYTRTSVRMLPESCVGC